MTHKNGKEQAAWLNSVVKLHLGASKVHGVGVFALRSIAKGQKLHGDAYPQPYNLVYSSFGKLFPEVRDLLLERWPNVVNGSSFAYPDTAFQCYMNHSDTPNYDANTDLALEDIGAGEEIFEDYRLIRGWEKVYPWLKKANGVV